MKKKEMKKRIKDLEERVKELELNVNYLKVQDNVRSKKEWDREINGMLVSEEPKCKLFGGRK